MNSARSACTRQASENSHFLPDKLRELIRCTAEQETYNLFHGTDDDDNDVLREGLN